MTFLTTSISINSDRLNQSLADLAQMGQLPGGGVSRVAFTDSDLAARQQLQHWMLTAGMTVRIDAAGNIIGRYDGQDPTLGALATGSHIDTVPVGGRFDGCLGVLAGLEIVRTLNDRALRLRHPIEVIIFTDEERSVIGSKAIAGEVQDDPRDYTRLDGTPIQDCLRKIGGDWNAIATARRDRSEIAAFVELHVEQGGILEQANVPIGIVTGVVGQYRFEVNIMGAPNHAGTTPMTMRKDALVAAAQVILAVHQIAVETPGDQVATVGYIDAFPNATNTIAGKVNLRIDLRDLSEDHLRWLIDQIQQRLAAIAIVTDTKITLKPTLHIRPTLASLPIMNAIAQSCHTLNLDTMYLPSRAGHDAQEIGRITAMGMIFVPSRSGISHSDQEYTTPIECAQGANVLLQTLLHLDSTL